MERMDFVSLEQNPFGMIQSILNCFNNKRELLYEWFKGNVEYIRDISRATLALHMLFLVTAFPVFALSDIVESSFRKGATVQFVLRKK
jgi:hypothetical protein